ncbi:MAG: hypothetical protein IMZ70_02265 [Candidatus Atribacteria bacterium]|nr:hypothetical protein [Candidatus Atribacteria bacterium]
MPIRSRGGRGLFILYRKIRVLVLPGEDITSLEGLEVELVSYQKAQTELGYSPRSIFESIKDAVQWFRQEGII